MVTRGIVHAAWIGFSLLAAGPSPGAAAGEAEDARRALEQAEKAAESRQTAQDEATRRARAAAAEATTLAQQRAEAAGRLQQAEKATAAAAARIDDLLRRRDAAERRLQARRKALQPFLPLMERLALYPDEALLAVPEPPDAALRGLLVMHGLVRRLQTEAEALRRDQADLDADLSALRDAYGHLTEAEAAQAQQGEALDGQIRSAHARQAEAEANAQREASAAAVAAAHTGSLRAAVRTLDLQRQAAEAKAKATAAEARRKHQDAAAARARQAAALHADNAGTMPANAQPHGQLHAPVTGVTVKGWGEATEAGPATGLSINAPPHARAVSPCGGQVVFADSFRSYGLLLIIDCGGGYTTVLAGFERLDVKLGQRLVAGEPVGAMPGWEPGSTRGRPALYVELRHHGQPVDPMPWLHPSS